MLSIIPVTSETKTNEPPAVFFKAGNVLKTQWSLSTRTPMFMPGVSTHVRTDQGPALKLDQRVPLLGNSPPISP